MNIQEIKSIAPAVFTSAPSPKMSGLYTFVNTFDILESFNLEGWDVSSVKQMGRSEYAAHEVRLRNAIMPKVGDTFPEVIISNSHNGMTRFKLGAGLFRLVCSNGLVVPTAIAQSISLRHQNFELGEVKRLTDEFALKMPSIQTSVTKMMSKTLSDGEKDMFVREAVKIRWAEGSIPTKMSVETLLQPKRTEDAVNNMWSTFNTVQENFIRGGFGYTSAGGRRVTAKQVNNILTSNRINTKLWELADSMC
jgi:hypothetical protein